jgi:hypothetical protein
VWAELRQLASNNSGSTGQVGDGGAMPPPPPDLSNLDGSASGTSGSGSPLDRLESAIKSVLLDLQQSSTTSSASSSTDTSTADASSTATATDTTSSDSAATGTLATDIQNLENVLKSFLAALGDNIAGSSTDSTTGTTMTTAAAGTGDSCGAGAATATSSTDTSSTTRSTAPISTSDSSATTDGQTIAADLKQLMGAIHAYMMATQWSNLGGASTYQATA